MTITEDGWTVHIEAKTPLTGHLDEDTIGQLLDALSDVGGSVTTQPGRYSATFSVRNAGTVLDASRVGLVEFMQGSVKAGIPVAPDWIVRLEALTFAEHDAEVATPNYPQLVGASEIADILGVSRQRITVLQTKPGFPAPIAVLKAGPVWDRAQLGHFIETWERKPGRPAKAS